MNIHERLAAWADSRLLPAGTVILLLLDVAVGINWLASPSRALAAPAYDVAKRVAPMAVHGSVFVAAAALAAVAFSIHHRGWWPGYLVGGLLAGLWTFWLLLFALAPIGTGGRASYAGALFAAAVAALHALFGLALTYAPQRRG